MANALQVAGAAVEQTRYAPIHTNRFFTGLWTQRNVLRDAATPFLYEKFYAGSRFDSLIDGVNVEISPRLTLARSPGSSVYNSASWAPVLRWYSFRTFSGSTETIKVIADTATDVYNGTGPSTHTSIFTKSGGAGQSYFQQVGNVLYFGDGVDQKQYDGTTVYNWGITGPSNPPSLNPHTDYTVTNGFLGGGTYATSTWFVDSAGYMQLTPSAFTAGFLEPTWNPTLFAITAGSYTNTGPNLSWQPSTNYTINQTIVDSNGTIQLCISPGTNASGTTQPTWGTGSGTHTTDGAVTWDCTAFVGGPMAASFGYNYSYAYHSITGNVSNVSPISQTGPIAGVHDITVGGTGTADTQCDFIWIFRTVDGGSTMFFCGQVANPGASSFTFRDQVTDANLNQFIQAPINQQNNPPPTGLINLTYWLNRIWGSVGNVVYYSRVADATAGTPVDSFPPLNYFVYTSLVKRLVPTAIGLLVFTTSDVYIILGSGTSTDPLYSVSYLKGIGLSSYNALDVNGSTIYLFTTDSRCLALDPSAGVSEVGFPIGNLLNSFNPSNVYIAWHSGGSADQALYVADGSTGWYRLSPTSAPETGFTWSCKRNITGGVKAVQSVETAPGTRRLLLGPTSSGSVNYRDLSTFQDVSTPYSCYGQIGSIVLAHPGQLAEISFIAGESAKNAGVHMSTLVSLDEISGFSGGFQLPESTQDPTQLPASATLNSYRYYFRQDSNPAFCRHLQIQFFWNAQNFSDELYTYTIFGEIYQDR